MGLVTTKPVFRVSNKRDSNLLPPLQRLARKLKFNKLQFRYDTFQKANIKGTDQSAHRCAGWSESLLFSNPEYSFSRLEALIICTFIYLVLIRALQTWLFSSLTLLEQLALGPHSVTYLGSMLPVIYSRDM